MERAPAPYLPVQRLTRTPASRAQIKGSPAGRGAPGKLREASRRENKGRARDFPMLRGPPPRLRGATPGRGAAGNESFYFHCTFKAAGVCGPNLRSNHVPDSSRPSRARRRLSLLSFPRLFSIIAAAIFFALSSTGVGEGCGAEGGVTDFLMHCGGWPGCNCARLPGIRGGRVIDN